MLFYRVNFLFSLGCFFRGVFRVNFALFLALFPFCAACGFVFFFLLCGTAGEIRRVAVLLVRCFGLTVFARYGNAAI